MGTIFKKEFEGSLEIAHRELNIFIKQHFPECLKTFEDRIRITGILNLIYIFNRLKQNLVSLKYL